jgi:hypothetical protein
MDTCRNNLYHHIIYEEKWWEMTRFDIKRTLLGVFTEKQDQIEAEMKTAILGSDEHYLIAELYSIMHTGKYAERIVEPYLRGLVSSSRGLGGKGAEQLISLLYPSRYQQYLFPYPMTYMQPVQTPVEPQEEQQGEEGHSWIPFLKRKH